MNLKALLEKIGAGIALLLIGAGPVVGPVLKRWALRSKAAAAVDEAQKAEAAALEDSWHSLSGFREKTWTEMHDMISAQRDDIKGMRQEIEGLRLEVKRLSALEAHAHQVELHSQELEIDNRTLRERLRALGEVA